MTILEDEINQVKGVVAVGYEIGRVPLERFDGLEETDFEMFNADGGFDRDLAREIISIPLSVPVRPVGYHLCTDSEQWLGILNMVMATLCKFMRLRMRIHHGMFWRLCPLATYSTAAIPDSDIHIFLYRK
jgi:hypothetical protein